MPVGADFAAVHPISLAPLREVNGHRQGKGYRAQDYGKMRLMAMEEEELSKRVKVAQGVEAGATEHQVVLENTASRRDHLVSVEKA